MAFITLNKARYFYRLEGEGEPIVLIAGFSCDHTFWDEVYEELVKNYRVLSFDNRAVGRTEDDGAPLSLEQMADETVQLFQQLKIDKPTVVGHSMGGMIAQIIGKKYSDSIQNLLVVNSTGKTNARTLMALDVFCLLVDENISKEAQIDVALPWFFSPSFLADKNKVANFKSKLLSDPFAQKINDLKRQLEAIRAFDIFSFSQPVNVRSLVISSKEDIICPPEESPLLAKQFLKMEQMRLDGGHSSPLEVPVVISKIIVNYCS